MSCALRRSVFFGFSAAIFLSTYLSPINIASAQTAIASLAVTPKEVIQGAARVIGHYEPTNMLRLTISLKSPKADELRRFNERLYNKNSPDFHKFLTPEQWISRFAPSPADEQMIVDWASSNGLSVTARHPHRLTISFEAPSDRIEQAFGVRMNHYQLGAQSFYSNDREPVMPAQMASVIESIDGLSSLAQAVPHTTGQRISNLEPQYSPGPAIAKTNEGSHDADASKMPEAMKASRAAKQNQELAAAAQPSFTNGNMDPTDLYNPRAYNWEGLNDMKKCCNPFHAADSPREASVAIVTSYAIDPADITGFHNTFPYLADHWTTFNIDGTPTCPANQSGCNFETTLDFDSVTEMANSFGAAADTAHVYIYQGVSSATNVTVDMYSHVLSDNKARVVTTSWGCAESSCYSESTMRSLHNIFEAMISQGYTLLAITGDQGATASTGSNNGAATCGSSLAVEYPGSDPDVVSVGGTALSISSIDDTFFSEEAWQGDTTKGSCSGNRGGSGGGVSSFWDRPSYQVDSSNSKRTVPDMSLNASNGFTQSMYYGGKEEGAFGTSIASPELAGFFAQENAYLLTIGNICGPSHNQACAPMGLANPAIYTLGRFPRFIGYPLFYDITTGCNSNDNTAANKLTAYCAGPGYDMVTGWGSINALYFAWGINAYLAGDFLPPNVSWAGATPDVWHNTEQTITWTVQDVGHDIFLANGVAGFSEAWDDLPPDLGDRTTNPSFNQPQFPNMTAGSAILSPAGQGCHHMNLRVWDNGGTTGLQSSPAYCYDTVPPTTQATVTGAQSGGVFLSSATITITSVDATSGTGVIAYSLGRFFQAYTGPIVFTQPGTYNLEYYSTDKAGNADRTRALTVTVKMPSTTTNLSSAANPSAFGATVMLAAKVTPAAGAAPVGTVTFKDGATILGTAGLSGGRAVLAVNGLHAGTHSLRAFYNGSATALASGSNTWIQTVSQAPTATSLSASPSSVIVGKPVTITATVTPSHGGIVVGNVLFKDGGVLIHTSSVNPTTKKAVLTTSTLLAGSHHIIATYSGNADNLASTSPAVAITVTKATSTTTLVSSLNPSIYGKQVTLSATVSPSSGAPAAGAVLFKDGTIPLGSAVVSPSTHKALIVVTTLGAGSHALTASYAGSSSDAPSNSPTLTETVAKAATTVTLTDSPNPSTHGTPVTFKATVTPAFGGSVNGVVDFKVAGAKFGSASINAATHQANYTAAGLPVGNQTITATFEGSTNLNPSASGTVTQMVK